VQVKGGVQRAGKEAPEPIKTCKQAARPLSYLRQGEKGCGRIGAS